MQKKSEIRIGIAADHAGVDMKAMLIAHLQQEGYAVNDFGTQEEKSVDYPDYAHAVAEAMTHKEIDWGILICGSGIGMSMAANRHPGIRAALCTTEAMAKLSRQHNNANILVLGARFTDEQTAQQIMNTFFHTNFEEGRHERRVQKIEGFIE